MPDPTPTSQQHTLDSHLAPRNPSGSAPAPEQAPRWLTAAEQATWRDWIFVTSRIDATMARELQRHSDLSLADYTVLVPLSEHPQRRERIAALAEALQWDRSRLSHQITRMAKRGLVRRESCAEDGRGAFVVIEPAGMEAIKTAAPGHVKCVQDSFFDQLDQRDSEDLQRILRKLAAQFENDRA
ncbi:MarR family winged helix-turn-helix transcriptional regulator [Corynebacterium auriscanis]|uniref:MarR family winged helix-turn-helix transcriptional regulator n=1 Tax=Corynebacterium auriscanis TaxID=99807 RepID=UPI003CF6AE88